MEDIDIFIYLELSKYKKATTIQDVDSFFIDLKNSVHHKVQSILFNEVIDVIDFIKKEALSKMELRFQVYKGQENSLFRRTKEYKALVIHEINLTKLSTGKLLIYKISNLLGLN